MAGGGLHGNFRLLRNFLLGHHLFRLGGQVNAALLTNFLVVPVNIGNQLTGGLIDNLQAGPQLLQFLALTPAGDIAEAVLASLDRKSTRLNSSH